MKKFRSLLIYAVVGALLGGYIYFFERGPVKDKSADKKLKVFNNFIADDIDQIHLENLATTVNAEKTPVDIQKDDKGVWRITSPKKLVADETMVRSLLNGVGDYAPDSSIDHPTDLSDYGLKNPATKTVFKTKAGLTFEVRVGDKNPAGSDNYVQVSGKDTIFLIPTGNMEALKKNVEDYRDHSFIKTDLVLARKIRMTRGGKTIELEKDKTNTWNLTKPIEEKADESKVRDLLSKLNDIHIESFVSDKAESLAPYGLSKPRVKIEIWPSDGGPSQALLMGRPKGKTNDIYAKTGDLPAVYLLSNYVDKSTDFKVSDFRDKTAMKFDASAVKSFSVKKGNKLTVYKKGDKGQWSAPGRPNANEEGLSIVSQLSSTLILDFAAKGAVTGLNNPFFVVTFTLNDNSTRVFRYGKREGEQVYLASDKTKDVYLVSPAAVSELETDFSSVLTPVPVPSPVPTAKK